MKITNITFILILSIASDVLAGYTVTDAARRRVFFNYPPTRIISQLPCATETIFAIGASKRLIGVTQSCVFPPEAQEKICIGSKNNPNLKMIISLKPDLVFINKNIHTSRLIRLYSQFGINVIVINPINYQHILASIILVGKACHLDERGKYISRKLAKICLKIKNKTLNETKPRVLFCTSINPIIAARPNTLYDNLINLAGAKNAIGYGDYTYPKLTANDLELCNPDIIITPSKTAKENLAKLIKKCPNINAVKQNKVYIINHDYIYQTGPSLFLGLLEMTEKIHNIKIDLEK